MKHISLILGIVFLACAAQAETIIYGSAEERAKAQAINADKAGYDKCIASTVKPLEDRQERIWNGAWQSRRALREKQDQAERELAALVNNADKKVLTETSLKQAKQKIEQLEQEELLLEQNKEESIQAIKEQVKTARQACEQKFPKHVQNFPLSEQELEKQKNLNQSVLMLLRTNQLDELKKMNFPGTDYGRVYDEIERGLAQGRATKEMALLYGLTTYYKELYKQDMKIKNRAHYTNFAARYKNTFLKEYIRPILFLYHGCEPSSGDAESSNSYRIGAKAIQAIDLWQAMATSQKEFEEGVRAIGSKVYHSISFQHDKAISDVKSILEVAYGESVKLNNKKAFHMLKREMFDAALADKWKSFLREGGLDVLVIAPYTPWEKERVRTLWAETLEYGGSDPKVTKRAIKMREAIRKHDGLYEEDVPDKVKNQLRATWQQGKLLIDEHFQ